MLYRFADHMFQEPYRSYYEDYRGHVFRISHYHPEDDIQTHVWLICDDDDSIVVKGYVHFQDLVPVSAKE